MPNNHSKYRTSRGLTGVGALVNFQRHDSGPGVQPPDSAAGAAFYLHMLGGEERPHRECGIPGLHAWQYNLPNRGLKLRRRGGDSQVSSLDHVNSVR